MLPTTKQNLKNFHLKFDSKEKWMKLWLGNWEKKYSFQKQKNKNESVIKNDPNNTNHHNRYPPILQNKPSNIQKTYQREPGSSRSTNMKQHITFNFLVYQHLEGKTYPEVNLVIIIKSFFMKQDLSLNPHWSWEIYPTLFNSPWLERKRPKHFFVANVSKET